MNLNKLLLAFVLLFATNASADYKTIHSLTEIEKEHLHEAIIFFDLDDTLIESSLEIGSKNWKNFIKSATTQQEHDDISWFIAQHIPVKTTEDEVGDLIQNLQTSNKVFGLTARERNIWYYTPKDGVDELTIQQLESAGIHFDKTTSFEMPEFYEGVYFSDLDPKGEYVLKLFTSRESLPSKVVFVDDKLSQVESVAEALDALGIDNECYYYKQTYSTSFDPLVALVQLHYLMQSEGKVLLTEQEAQLLIEQSPHLDIDYYLGEIINR